MSDHLFFINRASIKLCSSDHFPCKTDNFQIFYPVPESGFIFEFQRITPVKQYCRDIHSNGDVSLATIELRALGVLNFVLSDCYLINCNSDSLYGSEMDTKAFPYSRQLTKCCCCCCCHDTFYLGVRNLKSCTD